MDPRQGGQVLNNLGRRQTGQREHYNSKFNDELVAFTDRVIRVENARARKSSTDKTCEFPKRQRFGVYQISSLPSSRQPETADVDEGLERIVLHNVYYASRDLADDGTDVSGSGRVQAHCRQQQQEYNDHNPQGIKGHSKFLTSKQLHDHRGEYPDRVVHNGLSDHQSRKADETYGCPRRWEQRQPQADNCMGRHGQRRSSCASNGLETPPSSAESMEVSGLNFAKLRQIVEQVTLDEIRRQVGHMGAAGESKILVRVAQDILSANAKDAETRRAPVELMKTPSVPDREIIGPTSEEHSGKVTGREYPVASQSSPDSEGRPTANYGYAEESVIRSVFEFNGDMRSENDRGQYEGVSEELQTSRGASPDAKAESVMTSISCPPKSTGQEYPASLQSQGLQRDHQAEALKHSSERGSVSTQNGRTEEYGVIACSSRLSDAESPSSNPGEDRDGVSSSPSYSNQPSPASDEWSGAYRPSFLYDMHLQQITGTPSESPSRAEAETLSDQLVDSAPVDETCWYSTSIFKQARAMRQDIHATVRVFGALFQPFSCTQQYTASSQPSGALNISSTPPGHVSQPFGQCSETSQTRTSADGGSSITSPRRTEHSGGEFRGNVEQSIHITSVCSLKEDSSCAGENFQEPRKEFGAENASKPSVAESGLEEASTDTPAQRSPSYRCVRSLNISSSADTTEPAEVRNPTWSIDNPREPSSSKRMQTRPPDNASSDSTTGITPNRPSLRDTKPIQVGESGRNVLPHGLSPCWGRSNSLAHTARRKRSHEVEDPCSSEELLEPARPNFDKRFKLNDNLTLTRVRGKAPYPGNNRWDNHSISEAGHPTLADNVSVV